MVKVCTYRATTLLHGVKLVLFGFCPGSAGLLMVCLRQKLVGKSSVISCSVSLDAENKHCDQIFDGSIGLNILWL